MKARLSQFVTDLGESFLLVPAILVVLGILIAVALVEVDRQNILPAWLTESSLLYNGGGTGARTLLGAVASSTIGVAGTVFSITIASLSLAAGQMGPRLLRNFTKDRGNQTTLGVFLGTFSYALMVLRTVRTQEEGAFVPHLSLSFGIILAFVSVGTLVYFVGHIASRINVDTVIDLVGDEVGSALERLTTTESQTAPPADGFWRGGDLVRDARRGYLLQLDSSGLAKWAAEEAVSIRLLVRPGDYVFPGAPIALVKPAHSDVNDAIRRATALGSKRVSSADLEFAVRQLVEVAVRALSPGINDPNTAISVLDRLGAALCDLVPLTLPSGVFAQSNRIVLLVPSVTYAGLTDTMFHLIRQNAAGSAVIYIRMLEVFAAVVSTESNAERQRVLHRHADLVLEDAEKAVTSPADLADIRGRYATFDRVVRVGPASL